MLPPRWTVRRGQTKGPNGPMFILRAVSHFLGCICKLQRPSRAFCPADRTEPNGQLCSQQMCCCCGRQNTPADHVHAGCETPNIRLILERGVLCVLVHWPRDGAIGRGQPCVAHHSAVACPGKWGRARGRINCGRWAMGTPTPPQRQTPWFPLPPPSRTAAA